MVTKESIEKLRPLLQSGADAEFFFSSIKTAEWLPALLEGGFFKSPPEPLRGDGWIRYPAWPQSRYLARIARLAPEKVVEAALSIPETANAGVNDDIIETALAVPPPLAAKLMPRISQWIRQSDLRRAGEEIGKLIAHIAEGGAFELALQLLGWLVAFYPDPEKAEKQKLKEENPLGWGLEPQTRLSTHEYYAVLAATLPTLVRLNAGETLRLLAKTLADYVRERFEKEMPEGYDGSCFWRPSIPEHGQNSRFDAVTNLVSAFREQGEEAVNSGRLTADQVLALTQAYPWDIFKRFDLHWARVFRDRLAQGVVRRLLLTEAYLVGDRASLEYGLLLRDAFPVLEPEDQAKILSWVEQGPRQEDLDWMRQGHADEPAPADVLEARIGRWRVQRLYWIKDALSPECRTRYDAWAAAGGGPEHPGFHSWVGSSKARSESPMTTAAFHALSLNDQVEYLRSWEPETKSWLGPNRGGLAGVLQIEVKSDPVHYFESAEKFRGLEPMYVNALFGGFRESIKGKPVSTWNSFWALARWLVEQPDPEIDLYDEFTGRTRRGRRWLYARLEIARFLDAMLKGETVALPAAEREKIWGLIEALTGDLSPTPKDDGEERKESSMGPFTLSLNTVRGEAMHAVFSYIRWCRSLHWEEGEESAALNDVPEARQVLEMRLNPKIEPTQTIRSIYGSNASYLADWAESWLRQNRVHIFPEGGPERLRHIAWETFINYSGPNTQSLRVLHEEFTRAVRKMQKPAQTDKRNDPRVSLGRHLVVNYWWGNFDLDTPENLLAEFFQRAPEEVRADTLAFVGRYLRDSKEVISAEIITRLVKLWQWRLATANAAGGKGFHKEMSAFAWWFDSRKFDEDWAAKQMVQALELSRSMKNHFLWMKPFAEIAERRLPEAVRALELTVESALDGSIAFWDDDEAEVILSTAAKSENGAILAKARRVQSLLLRMGRKRFLHVIPLE